MKPGALYHIGSQSMSRLHMSLILPPQNMGVGEDVRPTISFLASMNSMERSGRVLDSRPKGRRFEPHWRHCVVSLSKTQ